LRISLSAWSTSINIFDNKYKYAQQHINGSEINIKIINFNSYKKNMQDKKRDTKAQDK
jgi:hypothetical protein